VQDDYRVPVTEGDRIRAGLAMQMIAMACGMAPDRWGERRRLGLRGCRARWLSMYLTHVGFGWPLERVGHAFGVNRATVGIGCRWAEEARDDPAIDSLLDRLEQAIRDLCEAPKAELAP